MRQDVDKRIQAVMDDTTLLDVTLPYQDALTIELVMLEVAGWSPIVQSPMKQRVQSVGYRFRVARYAAGYDGLSVRITLSYPDMCNIVAVMQTASRVAAKENCVRLGRLFQVHITLRHPDVGQMIEMSWDEANDL